MKLIHRRIDAVMEASKIAKGNRIITRGHILGFDQFLNAAFMTRLLLTRPNNLGAYFTKKVRKELKAWRKKWKTVKQTLEDLQEFKPWKRIRMKNDDEKLDSVLTEIQVCASDFSTMIDNLNELRDRVQGRKAYLFYTGGWIHSFSQFFQRKLNKKTMLSTVGNQIWTTENVL